MSCGRILRLNSNWIFSAGLSAVFLFCSLALAPASWAGKGADLTRVCSLGAEFQSAVRGIWTEASRRHIMSGEFIQAPLSAQHGRGELGPHLSAGLHSWKGLLKFLDRRRDLFKSEPRLYTQKLDNGVIRAWLPSRAVTEKQWMAVRVASKYGDAYVDKTHMGKTLFPRDWDEVRIREAIALVVEDPESVRRAGMAEYLTGRALGVRMNVVLDDQGYILSAFPCWNQ